MAEPKEQRLRKLGRELAQTMLLGYFNKGSPPDYNEIYRRVEKYGLTLNEVRKLPLQPAAKKTPPFPEKHAGKMTDFEKHIFYAAAEALGKTPLVTVSPRIKSPAVRKIAAESEREIRNAILEVLSQKPWAEAKDIVKLLGTGGDGQMRTQHVFRELREHGIIFPKSRPELVSAYIKYLKKNRKKITPISLREALGERYGIPKQVIRNSLKKIKEQGHHPWPRAENRKTGKTPAHKRRI